MKAVGVVAIAAIVAASATARPERAAKPQGSGNTIFFDDFTGSEIDRSKWTPEVWGHTVNNEQQAYIDSADVIAIVQGGAAAGAEGGALAITARHRQGFVAPKTGRTFDFVSGRLITRGNFEFTYGTVAARMKLPAGSGLWPAFWILGTGKWPDTGEIDVMEHVGDPSWTSVALHGPGYSGNTPLVKRFTFPAGQDATGWHVYSADWTRDAIVFHVDGQEVYRVTRTMVEKHGRWSYDNPKYLILNLALGGNYPHSVNGADAPYRGLPAATVDIIKDGRARVLVDWVRVTTPDPEPAPTTAVALDQAGYLPALPKRAFVVSDSTPRIFAVKRAETGDVVFRGELTPPAVDADSGDRVQAADFSALEQRGRFYLDVPGVGRSWTFAIGPDAYARAFYLSMRSFYGQRCGTDVDLGREFPGYSYEACHRRGAFHPSSGRSGPAPSLRGWHDAGDYGRYVVNSGITTGTLLWAWELFGDRLRGVSLDIPESRDRTPDMLDEIRWNLDWMLTMQDADGGVWHKQTSERFAPFVLPHDDTLISYIVGTGAEPYKSSCATADFAAVMAIAGRVYRRFDAKYAQQASSAARHAWTWLERHPNVLFRNPDGVTTGAYGDKDCSDERLWAAAELWRTTRDDVYEAYFSAHYRDALPAIRAVGPPSWANVAALGPWTYALGRGPNATAVAQIVERSSRAAGEIVQRVSAHPYRIALVTTDYVWGSNAVAANYGVQLLVANQLKPDGRYVETAAENLHYLLGRNPFSLSWVSGVGANAFKHPHHRPSGADANREPWPGLLAGGPNRRPQDPAMKRMPAYPPAKGYLDEQESYASNENAINWNAALVFLLAGLMQP